MTDAGSKFPDDRFRIFTLQEAWRGHDVTQGKQALRATLKPFLHFAPTAASPGNLSLATAGGFMIKT